MSTSVLFDAPGPRARLRNRVVSGVTIALAALVVWAVISRLAAKGQLTAAKWKPFLTADLYCAMLAGYASTNNSRSCSS